MALIEKDIQFSKLKHSTFARTVAMYYSLYNYVSDVTIFERKTLRTKLKFQNQSQRMLKQKEILRLNSP